MFTFNFDNINDIATLIFKNDFLEIECSPENFLHLNEHGYESECNNGECSIYYSEKLIIFEVAKYGDGEGGSLSISLKMTEEIFNSLKEALKQWKKIIDEKEKEEEKDN